MTWAPAPLWTVLHPLGATSRLRLRLPYAPGGSAAVNPTAKEPP